MLNLQQANIIAKVVISEGRSRNLKPLTVAVLDPGGHLVALRREDGASILRPQLAIGKAAGALALGVSSGQIAEMAKSRPSFVASISALAPQGIIPAPGGVIIADESGAVLGAVGVSGDVSELDEECALIGIAATGLLPLP